MYAINSNGREASLIKTTEASTNLKFDAPNGKVNTKALERTVASAVYYMAAES